MAQSFWLYRRMNIGTKLTLQGLNALEAKGMTKALVETEDYNPTTPIRLREEVDLQLCRNT